MYDNKSVPKASVVLKQRRNSTPRWVVLDCPYCGGIHTHLAGGGITDPYDELGSRASHCSPPYRGPKGDYVLTPIEPRTPWKPKRPK